MTEYIEKEKALKALSAGEGCGAICYRAIDRIPAAEVEPVRHGTWEPCFEDWRKQIEGDKCSACGFEHYGCSIRAYHYCPNCGARMDGRQ